MILSQLLHRVEVGRGYKITVELNMSYKQFFKLTGEEAEDILASRKIAQEAVA